MDRYHDNRKFYEARKRDRSSDSRDTETYKKSSKRNENKKFSFFDNKNMLYRILTGYNIMEQLVDDPNDFWLFLAKYEKRCKQNLQNWQDIRTETPTCDSLIPSTFNKNYLLSFKLVPSKHQMIATKSYEDDNDSLDDSKVQVFLTIVRYYLDFKQKERFNKLKKLRKFQSTLPIAAYEKEIVEAVKNESILILAGDTGCGKSTQVPQYLCKAGFGDIACTQPRRIACIGLSKRVSHEMLCEYESIVGYQIRFEKQKTKHTKILFLTEGLLLRKLNEIDENLKDHSVIILDEIHERNIFCDFLLGICKCLIKARPEIKIVLMSATININLFSNFFKEEQARVIEVPGRMHPIKLHYMPHLTNPELRLESKSKSEKLNPEPYIQIMSMIDKKYPKEEKGDLLIFVSGLKEIESITDAAKEYKEKNPNWIVLPLHSSLSMQDQDKVFDYAPEHMRKCIVSTNISETSLTIDGIRFVIDSGKMKEMTYDANYKMQRLKEMWISKASAEQRKGRAGRTGPGVCFRLYSEKQYNELENYSKAEIHRVPLESILLQMISMGLPNARLFPFIEPVSMENIENSILSLKQLEALTLNEKLTSLGKSLSKIPVDVFLGKMLLIGSVFRQLQSTLILAAILNVQSPFTNRAYRDLDSEKLRKDFESDHGDPFTLLNLYREWLHIKKSYDSSNRNYESSSKWSRKRGLEEQRFYEITKLKNQLENLLKECQLLEEEKDEKLTASERYIQAGEKKYLKSLQKAHRMEAPKQRKILKENDDDDDEDDDRKQYGKDRKVDIKDVEFRLRLGTKINNLLLDASVTSGRDVIMLKLILISGLYPKFAVSDEFNYCKSMNEQFFHTKSKPYVSMHPMSYFAKNYQELNTSAEVTEKIGLYNSKYALSSKHQLICYLSILETTKAYLINCIRTPLAQTLLFFSQEIDSNLTFSRIVCDSWICLDFPFPETGQTLTYRSAKLREQWNKLVTMKLDSSFGNFTQQHIKELDELENDLVKFMRSEVFYTCKRLLPADLKYLYTQDKNENPSLLLESNPFSDDFTCVFNDVKGGVFLTPIITYGCIDETDWSMQIAEEIYNTSFECEGCNMTLNLTNIQKLQHQNKCKPISETKIKDENADACGKQKNYKCSVCMKEFNLSNVEILKHKKSCRS